MHRQICKFCQNRIHQRLVVFRRESTWQNYKGTQEQQFVEDAGVFCGTICLGAYLAEHPDPVEILQAERARQYEGITQGYEDGATDDRSPKGE